MSYVLVSMSYVHLLIQKLIKATYFPKKSRIFILMKKCRAIWLGATFEEVMDRQADTLKYIFTDCSVLYVFLTCFRRSNTDGAATESSTTITKDVGKMTWG